MFDRTFAALYWSATAVGVGWLAWVCFANMPWIMAVLVLPLVLWAAIAGLAPAVAAAAALVAGIITGMVALIRAVQRRRAA